MKLSVKLAIKIVHYVQRVHISHGLVTTTIYALNVYEMPRILKIGVNVNATLDMRKYPRIPMQVAKNGEIIKE
jgi:hypothetical protein